MDSNNEFRKAVADAVPLRGKARARLSASAPAPVARQRHLDELAALEESLGPLSADDALDTGEELVYLREGLSRQVLRKLRRGHWTIQDALDLHGMTRAEAAAAVSAFLQHCLARGHRCVRIVHGKGTGVLKAKLRRWLPQRDEVLACCQAPARDGGSGALLVLLRSKR